MISGLQQGNLRLVTESAASTPPGESSVTRARQVPRRDSNGPARGYICENYGGAFTRPNVVRSAPIAGQFADFSAGGGVWDKDTPTNCS